MLRRIYLCIHFSSCTPSAKPPASASQPGCTLAVAKQPLPPQVVCQILGLDEETVKAAFEAGNPPVATEAQLIDAVKKSVDLGDSVEMYKPVSRPRAQLPQP